MAKLVLFDPGFLAVALFRLQTWFYERRVKGLPHAIKMLNLFLTGAEFTPGCRIDPGLIVRHPNGIVIGIGAVVGRNCTLLHQVTLGERAGDGSDTQHAYPVVGDNVVISAGAKVIGKTRLGDNVVIGANAVVLSDIPADCVAVGVPARVVRRRDRASSVQAG